MSFNTCAVASVCAAVLTFAVSRSVPHTVVAAIIVFPLSSFILSQVNAKQVASSQVGVKQNGKRSKRNSASAALSQVAADLSDDPAAVASRAKKAAKKAAVEAKKQAKAAAESAQAQAAASMQQVKQTVQAKVQQQQQQQQQPQSSKQNNKKAVVAPLRDSSSDDDENETPSQSANASSGNLSGAAAKKQAKKAAKKALQKAQAAAQPAVQQVKKAAQAASDKVQQSAQQIAQQAKQAAAQAQASADDGWTTMKTHHSPPSKLANKAAAAAQAAGGKNDDADASVAAGSASVTEEMTVPQEAHSQLIGIKGATLQLLQTTTGAKIDIPKRETNSSIVTLSGPPEAVARCRGAIDSMVRLGYSSITHPGQVHDEFTIDPKQFGVIIGPNGSTMKAIQSATSTRINLPKKDSTSTKCVVIGAKADVRAARQCIRDLCNDGFSPLIHIGIIKQTVEYPSEKLALLIGPKGQTIKSIQGNTKTKINTSSGIPDCVTVIGSAEGCAQAAKEIQRLLLPPVVVKGDDDSEDDEATAADKAAAAAAWSQQHAAPSEDSLW